MHSYNTVERLQWMVLVELQPPIIFIVAQRADYFQFVRPLESKLSENDATSRTPFPKSNTTNPDGSTIHAEHE